MQSGGPEFPIGTQALGLHSLFEFISWIRSPEAIILSHLLERNVLGDNERGPKSPCIARTPHCKKLIECAVVFGAEVKMNSGTDGFGSGSRSDTIRRQVFVPAKLITTVGSTLVIFSAGLRNSVNAAIAFAVCSEGASKRVTYMVTATRLNQSSL